jgi:predicted DCC family thiol-disulfide oxidoreductase YuxK
MNQRLQSIPEGKILVLFDGYCNLCNGAVQFIIRRDPKEKFLFAALSWTIGEEAKNTNPGFSAADSIMVYRNGKLYAHSSAALIIAGQLKGLWPLCGVFWIVPGIIRDAVYKWVARNRYRWFGKKDTCMIPDRDLSYRFLNQ